MSDKFEESIELMKNERTGIATICINNYKKRNALNDELMEQLSEVITELEKWSTGKAVIIYGTNGFFSSGVDLNFVRKHSSIAESGYHYSRLMHSNLSRLQCLPILTVAAVEGQALGGGAEILTACDIRIATKSAKIAFLQICMGVTTGWSGGTRLVHLLGPTKALDLLASGRVVTADEALAIGFVNCVFDDMTTTDQFIQEIVQWLKEYINCDINVTKECKQLCYLGKVYTESESAIS